MKDASDYYQIVLRDKKFPTVIAFSSVNTPKGRFKPYRIIAEAKGINIIFVNDSGNRWYQHGITGIADTSSEAAHLLVAEARRIGNGRVVTFGTSMGGFGAALFAALGGADGCLAFGLESLLGLPGSRSKQFMPPQQAVPYPDLLPIMESAKVPTTLYTSETDEIDLVNAARLVDLPNVTAISIRGMEHPGIQIFDLDGSVSTRITSFAQAGSMPEGFSKQGAILLQPALIEALWESFQLKVVTKDKSKWLEQIRSTADLWPVSATAQLRLGEAHYANSNGKGAEQAWRKAIALCPYQFESLTKLGNYLRRKKQIDEAKLLLLRAIDTNPWHAHGHHALGLLYAETNQLAKAEHHFRKAISINRGNKDFRRSLGELLIRLSKNLQQEGQELISSL